MRSTAKLVALTHSKVGRGHIPNFHPGKYPGWVGLGCSQDLEIRRQKIKVLQQKRLKSHMLSHFFLVQWAKVRFSLYFCLYTASGRKRENSSLRLEIELKSKFPPRKVSHTHMQWWHMGGGALGVFREKTASRLPKKISSTLVLAVSKTFYWPHLLIECACDAFDCKACFPDTLESG